jgi:hypothetical protein
MKRYLTGVLWAGMAVIPAGRAQTNPADAPAPATAEGQPIETRPPEKKTTNPPFASRLAPRITRRRPFE